MEGVKTVFLEDFKKELAIRDFYKYMKYASSNILTPFHITYYKILNLFAHGFIKNLIITITPQVGKSDGATRYLPSYMLGKNPDKKIAIGSYSDTFAQKFNRDIQRIIDGEKYQQLFPETKLNGSNVVTISSNYLRNSHEFEIVGKKGSLKAVGRGGALTGNPVDVMIMDDLYKDKIEGNSPIIRQNVIEWYNSVVVKRLHNDSQQLIVFTRWHEDDLIGYLEQNDKVIIANSFKDLVNVDPKAWIKINFEAIKESEPTELDPRQIGEALWPEKHSIEKLESERKLDPITFECMNQGNPETKTGLLYSEFKTYKDLPEKPLFIKAITDTADEGDCFLCTIIYFEYNEYKYVLDVIYTQDGNDLTEPLLAQRFKEWNVNEAKFESNNGGKSFAKNVERLCKEKLLHFSTSFSWYHQSSNKEARIISNSTTVTNLVVMPANWLHIWPKFYRDVTKFKRLFTANKYKDAPDTLTAMIEKTSRIAPVFYM